jgi:diguanylate cyclase (GGDEF)-like protein
MSENRRPTGNTPPHGYEVPGRTAAEDPAAVNRRLQAELTMRNEEIRRLNREKKDLNDRIDGQNVTIARLSSQLNKSPLVDMQILALDRMNEAIMIANAQGLLVYGNAASSAMFGEVSGANVHNVLFDRMMDPYAAPRSEDSGVCENPLLFGSRLWKSFASNERNFIRERVRIRMPSLAEAWYDVSFVLQRLEDRNGHPWALMEVLDIGSLNRDEITGLLRREVAISAMSREIAMGHTMVDGKFDRRNPARPVSVILVDLDDFKGINEAYGYSAGNKVLRKAAETLTESVRPIDLVCRWFSGDEFLIVVYADEDEASRIAERMCSKIKALRVHMKLEADRDVRLNVSASFGVAACGPDDDWKTLTDRAEKHAKTSKRDGKGRVTGQMAPLPKGLLPFRSSGT